MSLFEERFCITASNAHDAPLCQLEFTHLKDEKQIRNILMDKR